MCLDTIHIQDSSHVSKLLLMSDEQLQTQQAKTALFTWENCIKMSHGFLQLTGNEMRVRTLQGNLVCAL